MKNWYEILEHTLEAMKTAALEAQASGSGVHYAVVGCWSRAVQHALKAGKLADLEALAASLKQDCSDWRERCNRTEADLAQARLALAWIDTRVYKAEFFRVAGFSQPPASSSGAGLVGQALAASSTNAPRAQAPGTVAAPLQASPGDVSCGGPGPEQSGGSVHSCWIVHFPGGRPPWVYCLLKGGHSGPHSWEGHVGPADSANAPSGSTH
jgi:hypothetical protein